ncbi:hypothetical protein, partial [Streptomyces albipurpureus]
HPARPIGSKVPTKYRTVLVATTLLLIVESLAVAAFAFFWFPVFSRGFMTPLDEPDSMHPAVIPGVILGLVVVTANTWTCWRLIRSRQGRVSNRHALWAALVLQAVLFTVSALVGSVTGIVGTILLATMLVTCYRLSLKQYIHVR